MIGVGLKKLARTPLAKLPQSYPLPRATTGWLYRYYTAIRSLYHHVVCDVPVSCKANGDKNQLWAWLDSDLKAD